MKWLDNLEADVYRDVDDDTNKRTRQAGVSIEELDRMARVIRGALDALERIHRRSDPSYEWSDGEDAGAAFAEYIRDVAEDAIAMIYQGGDEQEVSQ